MQRYRVEFVSGAHRELDKLNVPIRSRVLRHIIRLETRPRPVGCEKLRGRENRYRIRVGDYRVIYEIHDKALLVLVIAIAHRREVHRKR